VWAGKLVNVRANLWAHLWNTSFGPFEDHINSGYYLCKWVKKKNANTFVLKFLCSGDTLDVTKAWLLEYGSNRDSSSTDFEITEKMYQEVELPARDRMSVNARCDVDLPEGTDDFPDSDMDESTPGSTTTTDDEEDEEEEKKKAPKRIKQVAKKAKAPPPAKQGTNNVMRPQLCSQNEECDNDCVLFVFDRFYTPFSISCMRPRYARGMVANPLSLNVASLCLTSLRGKRSKDQESGSTPGSTPDFTWRIINCGRYTSKKSCRTIDSEGCGEEEGICRGCR